MWALTTLRLGKIIVLFFRKVFWYLFLESLDFSVPKFMREKLIILVSF